jgi:hypothetical protein
MGISYSYKWWENWLETPIKSINWWSRPWFPVKIFPNKPIHWLEVAKPMLWTDDSEKTNKLCVPWFWTSGCFSWIVVPAIWGGSGPCTAQNHRHPKSDGFTSNISLKRHDSRDVLSVLSKVPIHNPQSNKKHCLCAILVPFATSKCVLPLRSGRWMSLVHPGLLDGSSVLELFILLEAGGWGHRNSQGAVWS